MAKSNRRTYVDLAESIRSMSEESASYKTALTVLITGALAEAPGFDADRFQAHALSEDPAGKWAHNRATGQGPQGEADTDYEEDEYSDEGESNDD